MKMQHLTDLEIASFIDGKSIRKKRVIEHLNRCKYCFEITTETMHFVESNKELCRKLNVNYEKWVKNFLKS